jgi:UDP-perosamine 4-acetyltransferase
MNDSDPPALPPLLIYGAGGHAKSVIGIITDGGGWAIHGLIDEREDMLGKAVLGHPVVGSGSLLPELLRREILHAFVAVGDNASRQQRGRQLEQLGFHLPILIHPTALIMTHASISVGRYAIIGAHAGIGHESILGDAVHVGAGSILGGNVHIGSGSFLGLRSVVLPGITIGRNVRVAAGSMVSKDIADNLSVAGSPARVVPGSG